METNPSFGKYMTQYYDFTGQWDSPSRCGLRTIRRRDGKILIIVTELYRQNPGTPVTEWCAPLATRLIRENGCHPDDLIFVEHTPDLGSKLDFYHETFDLVGFEWDGESFRKPAWTRISAGELDKMMEE